MRHDKVKKGIADHIIGRKGEAQVETDPKASGNAQDGVEPANSANADGAASSTADTKDGIQPASSSSVALEKSAADKITQSQTNYKILEDALLKNPPPKTDGGRAYYHPVLLDCVLACGLLIAMGGFTIGLFKIYLTHSAEQSITQRNYKAAIAILKGAPFPGLFTVTGRDPQELLNQALYLEAMDKLDANNDDQTAIHELTQIKPGSKFFDLAQEIVKEHTVPSSVQLEGQTQNEPGHDRVIEDNMPVLPPETKENN